MLCIERFHYTPGPGYNALVQTCVLIFSIKLSFWVAIHDITLSRLPQTPGTFGSGPLPVKLPTSFRIRRNSLISGGANLNLLKVFFVNPGLFQTPQGRIPRLRVLKNILAHFPNILRELQMYLVVGLHHPGGVR